MRTSASAPALHPAIAAVHIALAVLLSAAAAKVVAAQEAQQEHQDAEAPVFLNAVEVGGLGATDGSFKAGEYNGLYRSGVFALGNVNLRDRTAYDSPSARRWRLEGRDLGLDTRSAFAEFGTQGRYRIIGAFGQLRRNRSDTYQTIYDGAGSHVLTLPPTWIVPTIASPAGNTLSARGLVPANGAAPYLGTGATNQGALIQPTGAQIALVNAAAAADLAAFHDVKIFTTRTSALAAITYHFDERWAVDADIRPEHKEGSKPMGTVSRNTGGDIATIVPDPIDNNHNQVDTAIHYTGKRAFLQAGYYGSFFTNHVPFMSWQNWATSGGTVNTMSSAPNNMFSQLSGSAALKVGATGRITADGSYGRASQNEAFLTDATTPVVPVSSPDALVVSRLFHAKFTNRPRKSLNVAVSYRLEDRDNRTPIHLFQYSDAGESPAVNNNFVAGPNNPFGLVLAQNANANRPYSRTSHQVSLDVDYKLTSVQGVKAGYDFERLNRACPGAWIDCEDAARTNQQTARADWHATIRSAITARAGYAHAMRRAPAYNENAFLALVPFAGVSPASATGGATAVSFMNANGWNGWGPPLGFAATTGNMNVFFPGNSALANAQYANNNRISELRGLRRYWVADRDRDQIRSSLAWQAGESYSFQGGVNFNRDDYPGSTYGLQNAKGWTADIDAAYMPSDTLSADVFYTYERQAGVSAGNTYTANSNAATIANGQPGAIFLAGNACDSFATLQERNNHNKLDPCLNWSSDTRDRVHTVGFDLTKKVGIVAFTGMLTLARAQSTDNVSGGNWANNVLNGAGGPPTTIAAYFIPAAPLPVVTSNTAEFRAAGTVPIAKSRSLKISYAYLQMSSSDWMYEGMSTGAGTLSGVLPTNEQPFKYKVSVFGFSYVMSF
jgi:MtrB/PioB family decaheme-associated outer membrane protein